MTINVPVTLANTTYNLLALIKAIKDGVDTEWEIDEVKQLQVQLDPNLAGAVFRRGDSLLSDTVYGAQFVPGDFDTWGPLDSGGIFLSDFNYRSSIAAGTLHVSFIPR